MNPARFGPTMHPAEEEEASDHPCNVPHDNRGGEYVYFCSSRQPYSKIRHAKAVEASLASMPKTKAVKALDGAI